jgi:hypothetical protein
LLILLAAAVIAAAYSYLTRPARLRVLALRALRDLPLGSVDVEDVLFSPTGELRLTELVAGRAGALPALRIGALRVACRLPDLLLGHVRPTEIELSDVAVTVVCGAAEGADEALTAQAGAEARLLSTWLPRRPADLPRVTVEGGDVQLFVMSRGKPRLLERRLWRADGHATQDGYELRVKQRPAGGRPLATLAWRPAAGELECAVDWVDLRTVTHLVPQRVAEALGRAELSGRVRANHLVLQVAAAGSRTASAPAWMHLAAADLRMADGRGALPVEDAVATPNGAPFLRFSELSAALDYRGATGVAGRAVLVAEGRLCGAPATLRASLAAAAVRRLWQTELGASGECASEAGGGLGDIEQAELSITALELPTAERCGAFIHATRLPGPIATVLKDYAPRGRLDARLRLLPAGALGADGKLLTDLQRLEGEFRPRGAMCRYFRFPYAFTDVTGLMRLTNGQVLLEDVRARHGGAEIHASGRLHGTHSWTGFELEFRGQRVELDSDLYAALPAEYRELWDTAAPLGQCDVLASVARPEGSTATGAQPAAVTVDAQLLAGSVALGDGQRLTQASGGIRIHDRIVEVRNLQGRAGDAAMRLDGVQGAGERAAQTNLSVEVSAWPIQHEAELGDGGLHVRFAGHADASGRVFGGGAGTPRAQDLDVRITDGELVGGDPRRPWTVTAGQVRVRGAQQEILSLSAHQGAGQLELSGLLPQTGTPAALSLRLHATAPRAEELFPQFLPDKWLRRVESFDLRGPVDVTVALHAEGEDPASARQVAEVALQVAQARPQALPLELRDLTAELAVAPDRFRLLSAVANCGEGGQVQIRQAGDGLYAAGGSLEAVFELTATRLAVTRAVLAALPAGLGRLLERAGASGEFDAHLPRVQVSGDGARTWKLEGGLTFRNFGLQSGFELGGADGELAGACTVFPDGGVELQSQFALRHGQLDGRPLEDWRGQLSYAPGARWVQLDDVAGRICDGVVQGTLWIDPETSDYELTARLHDLAVAKLPAPSQEPAHALRPGRLGGEVWLRGRAGDAGSRHGGGTVRVSGASFIQTPVLALVFQQRQKRGESDTLDLADVRFRWEGREIVLDRIDIRSRDVRLVGAGRWTPGDDRLRMTLWAADPELWPRLGMLGEWLQTAGQDLVQYRVEGTLASPKVTAEPLHRLSAALRQLLGEQ